MKIYHYKQAYIKNKKHVLIKKYINISPLPPQKKNSSKRNSAHLKHNPFVWSARKSSCINISRSFG